MSPTVGLLFTPHPHFDMDHESIGASAANILLDAGNAEPVLIAPPADQTYSLQFTKGWRQAHANRRPESVENTILFAALTPNSGQEIVGELFAKNPAATAAFIASEEAALGFVAGLREMVAPCIAISASSLMVAANSIDS